MDKLIILPELMESSERCQQKKRAKEIMEQYYSGVALPPQRMLSDVVNAVFQSEYRQIFIDSMMHLKIEKLYKSSIHGQDHIERVCLLTAYLAIQCNVEKQMFKISMEAAKYHDIGRRDDTEDRIHGYRGSRDIPGCCERFCESDCEMIRAVVEAHSLLDEEARLIFEQYGLLKPSDYEKYQQILYIIKDADALDRFRLTDHSLCVEYLRMPESMQLIQAACEMNQTLPK